VPSVLTQSMGAEPPSLLSVFCVGVCRLGWRVAGCDGSRMAPRGSWGGGGGGGGRRFRDARPVAARTCMPKHAQLFLNKYSAGGACTVCRIDRIACLIQFGLRTGFAPSVLSGRSEGLLWFFPTLDAWPIPAATAAAAVPTSWQAGQGTLRFLCGSCAADRPSARFHACGYWRAYAGAPPSPFCRASQ